MIILLIFVMVCVIITIMYIRVKKAEKNMQYNALDVARYIINYSHEQKYDISNLKLQKLLYFVQAHFLVTENKECFSDKIVAWDFGPVVPAVYMEYKKYGNLTIPYIKTYIKIDKANIWNSEVVEFDSDIIRKKDKKRIHEVVDGFSDYNAVQLVDLTHKQAPWKNAYQKNGNCIITSKAIKEYFNERR